MLSINIKCQFGNDTVIQTIPPFWFSLAEFAGDWQYLKVLLGEVLNCRDKDIFVSLTISFGSLFAVTQQT